MLYINKNYVNLYQNSKNVVISPKTYLQNRNNSTAGASPSYGQKLNVQLQQQYLQDIDQALNYNVMTP